MLETLKEQLNTTGRTKQRNFEELAPKLGYPLLLDVRLGITVHLQVFRTKLETY